jgi:hypothetical protein
MSDYLSRITARNIGSGELGQIQPRRHSVFEPSWLYDGQFLEKGTVKDDISGTVSEATRSSQAEAEKGISHREPSPSDRAREQGHANRPMAIKEMQSKELSGRSVPEPMDERGSMEEQAAFLPGKMELIKVRNDAGGDAELTVESNSEPIQESMERVDKPPGPRSQDIIETDLKELHGPIKIAEKDRLIGLETDEGNGATGYSKNSSGRIVAPAIGLGAKVPEMMSFGDLPKRYSSKNSGRGSELPPPIKVTIGRIEVRAITPEARPTAQRTSPKLSLDAYLKERRRGER